MDESRSRALGDNVGAVKRILRRMALWGQVPDFTIEVLGLSNEKETETEV